MQNHGIQPILIVVSFWVSSSCKISYHASKTKIADVLKTCKNENSSLPSKNVNFEYMEGKSIADQTSFWSGNFKIISEWILIKGCYNLQPGAKGRRLNSDPVAQCYNWCDNKLYFGLKNTTCYCFGKEILNISSKSEQLCTIMCEKSLYGEMCGGRDSMTLYKIVTMQEVWHEKNKNLTIISRGQRIILQRDYYTESCLALNCLSAYTNKLSIYQMESCENITYFKGVCDDNSENGKTGTREQQREACKRKNKTLDFTYSPAKHCSGNDLYILNIYRRNISSDSMIRYPSDLSSLRILSAEYCTLHKSPQSVTCHDEELGVSTTAQKNMSFICYSEDVIKTTTTSLIQNTTEKNSRHHNTTINIQSTYLPDAGSSPLFVTSIVVLCIGIILIIITTFLLICKRFILRINKVKDVEKIENPDDKGSQEDDSDPTSQKLDEKSQDGIDSFSQSGSVHNATPSETVHTTHPQEAQGQRNGDSNPQSAPETSNVSGYDNSRREAATISQQQGAQDQSSGVSQTQLSTETNILSVNDVPRSEAGPIPQPKVAEGHGSGESNPQSATEASNDSGDNDLRSETVIISQPQVHGSAVSNPQLTTAAGNVSGDNSLRCEAVPISQPQGTQSQSSRESDPQTSTPASYVARNSFPRSEATPIAQPPGAQSQSSRHSYLSTTNSGEKQSIVYRIKIDNAGVNCPSSDSVTTSQSPCTQIRNSRTCNTKSSTRVSISNAGNCRMTCKIRIEH